MKELRIGDIIKVQVVGIQPYGIFIKSMDNEEYSGLIHISEISNDFVKDVSKVASNGDILFAKILDIDKSLKHIKLSIKATQPKTRYKSNYIKQKSSEEYSDFKPLSEHLNGWITEQLKEKKRHD